MNTEKIFNTELLNIDSFIDHDYLGYYILINAGCDTTIPKTQMRKAHNKTIIIRQNKAFLFEKTLLGIGLTPNKAYLIGIKDALLKVQPNTKCNILIPIALGFEKAKDYQGINVNYIIDIQRTEIHKKLDVTIKKITYIADNTKQLYLDICKGISPYELVGKNITEEILSNTGE